MRRLIIAILLAIALSIGRLALDGDTKTNPTPMNSTYFLYIERSDVDWSEVAPVYTLYAADDQVQQQ
jgi:hypothetical protein